MSGCGLPQTLNSSYNGFARWGTPSRLSQGFPASTILLKVFQQPCDHTHFTNEKTEAKKNRV